jgi:hypothetical protein
MKLALKAGIAALALFAAAPASAALTIVANCDATTPDPNALDCGGYYAGNLNSNNPTDEADLQQALDDLLGVGVIDYEFTAVEGTKEFFDETGGILTFDAALFGTQVFSLHFGGAGNYVGDVTVLYLFDFGTEGATEVNLNQDGFSNGIIITPPGGVPEPATWAMMLMGFGAAGYALRRRRKVLITQVA